MVVDRYTQTVGNEITMSNENLITTLALKVMPNKPTRSFLSSENRRSVGEDSKCVASSSWFFIGVSLSASSLAS